MGYVLGVEDEEHVDVGPLVGEQLLRPLDEVDAEVLAVCGAGRDLRSECVIAEAVGPVLVHREAGHGEQLGPLELVVLQRLELQRPDPVVAPSADQAELRFHLVEHVADHVA